MSGSIIKGVVFDFGGVLVDWNPRYLYRQLLGDEAAVEGFLAEVSTSAWNEAQDAGRSLADGTAERVARFPARAELIRAYYDRWPEMLGGAIDGTVAILADLKKAGVPLFGLTNFSAETLPIAVDRYDFLTWFDDVVVSGAEKLIKPDRRIFDVLVRRAKMPAGQLVFIDDRLDNVEGARAAGLAAVQFTTPETLRADLGRLGLPA